MGLIYMGTSPSGKKYIGQHNTDDFAMRKQTHNYRYIEFLKKKCILELNKKFHPDKEFSTNPKGFCTALYCAFQKHGFDSFQWEVLIKGIDPDDLDVVEDYFIFAYDTLVPKGYNLKMNTKEYRSSTYSDATLKQMSVSHTKSRKEHLHKYRKKHEELKDVPQFVTYFDSGGIRGYRIVRHPKCPFKQFADAETPVEDLKRQMMEFLSACEDNPYVTVQQRKQLSGIPKGIVEQKPGRFLVCFAKKGIRYNKFFSMSPRESALAAAVEWMQNKKSELAQEEGSTTKRLLGEDEETDEKSESEATP